MLTGASQPAVCHAVLCRWWANLAPNQIKPKGVKAHRFQGGGGGGCWSAGPNSGYCGGWEEGRGDWLAHGLITPVQGGLGGRCVVVQWSAGLAVAGVISHQRQVAAPPTCSGLSSTFSRWLCDGRPSNSWMPSMWYHGNKHVSVYVALCLLQVCPHNSLVSYHKLCG